MAFTATKLDDTKLPPSPEKPRIVPPSAQRQTKVEPKAQKKVVALATQKEIERWFAKTYLMMGTFLSPVKPALGNQILISAEKCAKANAQLCMENAQLRRAISAMMVTSIWGAVIAAHLPIILVIVAEYRTDDENARFNSQTLMGLAALISEDGLSGLMGGDDDADSDSGD